MLSSAPAAPRPALIYRKTAAPPHSFCVGITVARPVRLAAFYRPPFLPPHTTAAEIGVLRFTRSVIASRKPAFAHQHRRFAAACIPPPTVPPTLLLGPSRPSLGPSSWAARTAATECTRRTTSAAPTSMVSRHH